MCFSLGWRLKKGHTWQCVVYVFLTWVEVEEGQAQLLTPLQLVQQQGAALGARLRVWRAQVHQIGAVGDHQVARVAVRLGRGGEIRHLSGYDYVLWCQVSHLMNNHDIMDRQ